MALKIGEFFIQLGVKGDTKELDKSIKQMEEAQKRNKDLLKYRQDLAKAETQSEKALVKKNFADKIQLENMKKQSASIKQQNANWVGLAKGVLGFIGAATLAYKAMDRLITSFASANQQMITFQRTTGLSFNSLNKYASANAAVNFNSSIEGTAQTMSRLANNLYDIRMGRGDISPYQELAFVGGKAFNPMGMSVEQLIENVREAIKGVDDVQATNIIQRMGFAPDDLLMLRMSREEFEKINDLFISPEQREAMNRYSLELKKVKLEFDLLKDKTLLKLAPVFINITKHLQTFADGFAKLNNFAMKSTVIQSALKGIATALGVLLLALNPTLAGFTALYLVLEDLAYWMVGKGSVIGDWFGNRNGVGEEKDQFKEKHPRINAALGVVEDIWNTAQKVRSGEMTGEEANAYGKKLLEQRLEELKKTEARKSVEPVNTNQLSYNTNNINTNNQFTINSNQPTEKIAQGLINTFMPSQVQFSTVAV